MGVHKPASPSYTSDQLKKTYNIPPDRLVILFLSRLHYTNRPDLLLEAITHLSSQIPTTHLILAGSGDTAYGQYLRDYVEKAGLRDRVTFTGFVTGHEKSLLLQGADLFVLPSFSENFGIAIAEAMVAGLPVIITKGVQIAPDVEAAHAGLIINGDLESLRSALEKLLTSPELRKVLGANARRLAQTQYHWPTITQNLIQAYEEILRGEFHGNFP